MARWASRKPAPLCGFTICPVTWDASLVEQANPQQTGADGGRFLLDVSRSGYQANRTGEIDAVSEPSAHSIAVSPTIPDAATQTIAITEQGFVPLTVAVGPGNVVAFINVDLAEHAVNGSGWDSGLVAPGATHKVRATTETFAFADASDSLNKGMETGCEETLTAIPVL